MRIVKVIPSKRWQHKITGKQASIYGAFPGTPNDRDSWEIVQVGWTWQLDNGTIGLGGMLAKSESEALEIMAKFNNNR